MNVLLVDEDIEEVSSYMYLVESLNCRALRYRTFSDAYMALADEHHRFGFLIIDIMLPWGTNVPEEVGDDYGWKTAGMWLIRAVRQTEFGGLKRLIEQAGLPALPDYLREVPILALTKIAREWADELSDIPNVTLTDKSTVNVPALRNAFIRARDRCA